MKQHQHHLSLLLMKPSFFFGFVVALLLIGDECRGWAVVPSQQQRQQSTTTTADHDVSTALTRTTATTAAPCRQHRHRQYLTIMALAGSKSRNKQADLLRKLELAKKQKKEGEEGSDDGDDDTDTTTAKSSSATKELSDEEIKERNDRLRFEELLKRESSKVLNDYSSDGYLTKEQEEEEIAASRSGNTNRLFEGDPAPTECFEELISIKSENAIGVRGAERLVPWLHKKNPTRQSDYLIVLCDPRQKSPELKGTIQRLRSGELPPNIYNHLIVINADSPAENRRWLKKNGMYDAAAAAGSSKTVELYSDEKLEWMRSYTALGEKRWSMTMFVLAEGKIQKLAREVDMYGCGRTICNAEKSLQNEKRL